MATLTQQQVTQLLDIAYNEAANGIGAHWPTGKLDEMQQTLSGLLSTKCDKVMPTYKLYGSMVTVATCQEYTIGYVGTLAILYINPDFLDTVTL